MGFGLDPLSTLIGVAGDIGNTALSAEFSRRAQKRQIAWEKERATHAHQWEVEDLKNAGLNPILSAGGSGAVTGGISAPVPDTSGLSELKNSIQTGIQAKTAKKEQKLLDEQTEQAKSQTALNKANEKKALADTANTAEDTRRLKAQADQAQAEFDATKPRLETQERYNNSKFGRAMGHVKYFTGDASDAVMGAVGLGGAGAMLKNAFKKNATTTAIKAEKALFDKTHYVPQHARLKMIKHTN